MTATQRLKRFLANRGTGFSTDDIEAVLAENERLRALVKEAFWEGFQSGKDGGWIGQGHGKPWDQSEAKMELEKLK